MNENPILYVVLNGELNMRAGKAAAQAVHAAMMLDIGSSMKFKEKPKRTVVVLEAKDSDTIKNLYEYLNRANIYCKYYIDENARSRRGDEDLPYQVTALAVSPIEYDDKETRNIFSDFPLFGYKKDIWGRIEASFHK